jgi:hypothetical protein
LTSSAPWNDTWFDSIWVLIALVMVLSLGLAIAYSHTTEIAWLSAAVLLVCVWIGERLRRHLLRQSPPSTRG